MFWKKKTTKPDNICVIIRDAVQSPYAIVSISRASVINATYITATGVLQLLLTSVKAEGGTESRCTEIVKPSKGKDGRIETFPTGSYKQELYYNYLQDHHTVNIANDEEIEKIWNWWSTDISFKQLLEMKQENIDKNNEFKEKKRKEAQDKAKQAEEKKTEDLQKDELLTDERVIQELKKGKMGVAVNNTTTQEKTEEVIGDNSDNSKLEDQS